MKRPAVAENLKEIVKRAPSLSELGKRMNRPHALETIGGLVKRAFEKEEASKYAAHNRLQAVLLQDRSSLSAEGLGALRHDLRLVMSEYVIADRDSMEMDVRQCGEDLMLIANVRVNVVSDPAEELDEEPKRLLSPRRAAALKRELLEVVSGYLSIDAGSVQVEEERFSDSIALSVSVKIEEGEGFSEDASASHGMEPAWRPTAD